MSAEINENNKKLNREETILSQNNQELKIISKNKNNSTKYELFTKKCQTKGMEMIKEQILVKFTRIMGIQFQTKEMNVLIMSVLLQ